MLSQSSEQALRHEFSHDRARAAARIALLQLAVAALFLVVTVRTGVQSGAWQYGLIAAATTAYAISAFMAFILSKRDRALLGMGAMLATMFVGLGVTLYLTDDSSLVFRGRSLVIVALIIVVLTVPSRRLGIAAVSCIFGGVLLGLVDIFRPQSGFTPAAIMRQTFILSAVIQALVLGGMLAVAYRRQSIATKLVVAFVVVALAPVAILGYGQARSMQSVLRATAEERLQSAAQRTANEIDNYLQQQAAAVEVAAQAPLLAEVLALPPETRSSGDAVRAERLLQSHRRQHGVSRVGLVLFDSAGNVVAASSPAAATAPQRAGIAIPDGTEIELSSDSRDVTIAAPVYNETGRAVGTLAAIGVGSVLQEIADGASALAGEQSYAVVVDENGHRLADGKDPGLNGTRLVSTERADGVANAPRMIHPTDLSLLEPNFESRPPGDLMAISAEVQTIPWTVYFVQPAAVLAGPLRREAYAVHMTTLVAGLVVTLFGVALAQQIGGPLQRLTRAAERIQGGDLVVQVPVETPDEIGRLAAAFNAMAVRLREMVEGLESRVVQLKEAEGALVENEGRLRHIFESAPVGMCLVSPDGEILDVNLSLCECFGYSREELLNARLEDLTVADDLAELTPLIERLNQGEDDDFETEVRYLRKDGVTLDAVLRVSVMRDTNGRPQEFVAQVLDVTESRRSQRELAVRERELRAIMDHAPIGMVVVSPEGKILDANRSMCEVTGYSLEEMLGRGTPFLTHPDDIEETLERSRRLLSGEGDRFMIEKRYVRKDGAIITVLLGLALVRDHEGQPQRFVAQVVDLSELRDAQAALETSEREMQAILEHAPVGMAILTPGLKYVHVNHALSELLGYSQEELLAGGRVSSALGSEWDQVRRGIEAIINDSRSHYAGEHRVVRKDGEIRDCLIHITLVRDAEQQPLHLIGQALDITERNRAERKLRESEERYRLISENSTDIIAVHAPDARLIYVSPVVKTLLGYDPESLNGRRTSELVHPDDWALAGYEEDGNFVPAEAPTLAGTFRLRHADGHYVWFETRSKPVIDPASGKILEVVSVLRNITERLANEEKRRELEAQVQHAQKLESLGVLAGGIAHDFNNLLVGMLGHAGLALMDLPQSHAVYDNIRHIETAARRASELTKQLLAYSGKGQFVIEPVDINHVVREMSNLLELSASKKAMLQFELAGDLPIVEADSSQMRQIVMNLITNASDALGDREGSITVETSVREVCEEDFAEFALAGSNAPGSYVCLRVADTGCGMNEETVARIFDPFFTTKLAGRGLGLAAVLGIVRGHGGMLKVESAVGRGTAFEVYLPAADTPAEPSMATSPEDANGAIHSSNGNGSRTILVVDDEEMVRSFARMTLEKFGYRVLTANDGREGVALYRENASDIHGVLLDMTMPYMDGEQTFNALRELNPEVRVVLSSGYDQQDTVRRFPDRAPVAFIQKPYKPAALIALLRNVLES